MHLLFSFCSQLYRSCNGSRRNSQSSDEMFPLEVPMSIEDDVLDLNQKVIHFSALCKAFEKGPRAERLCSYKLILRKMTLKANMNHLVLVLIGRYTMAPVSHFWKKCWKVVPPVDPSYVTVNVGKPLIDSKYLVKY